MIIPWSMRTSMAGVGFDGGAGWGWDGRGHHRDDRGRRRMTHHHCEGGWIYQLLKSFQLMRVGDDGDGS